MELFVTAGKYTLRVEPRQPGGFGVAVDREAVRLYEAGKPLILLLKDYAAKHIELDAPYQSAALEDGVIVASGAVETPLGSRFRFTDRIGGGEGEGTFLWSRRVEVEAAAEDDLGFGTRISLGILRGDSIRDFNCFAPGAWYLQNRHTPKQAFGHDPDLPVYWARETRFALPLFLMQSIRSGDSVAFCRGGGDITASGIYENTFDSRTDPSFTYGSLGASLPGGLSIDYVYPGTEGCNEEATPYADGPYRYQFAMNKRYHPVTKGFVQEYAVSLRFAREESYYKLMRDTWRHYYRRFACPVAPVDNEKLYHVSMDLLDSLCREYHGAWGVPFKCLLPSGEIGIVDYQMGFIGQQPNIGYQLIRYGYRMERPETARKGEKVLDFWVEHSLTGWGAAKSWYDPHPARWLDQPIWLRMMADGLEGILDGYLFLREQGREKLEWLAYCKTVGDWLVSSAGADGTWHRAYHHDGSVHLECKANTSNIIRFLVQLHLATGEERYRAAAVKAGEWCYSHVYRDMEYLGGTCDNEDVLDKESGIYALFAFLALYDLTREERWLEAAVGAADYTETWTYAWIFPVKPIEKVHAYHHVNMSGQSLIATGHSGADVYMAACAYLYFRLYVITGDGHYQDFANFINKNPKQVTDIDGSLGYGRRGLCEESSTVANFDSRGVYAWLPWCTYVQVDPLSRLLDTFGAYEIGDCCRLPMEELRRRNDIYHTQGTSGPEEKGER